MCYILIVLIIHYYFIYLLIEVTFKENSDFCKQNIKNNWIHFLVRIQWIRPLSYNEISRAGVARRPTVLCYDWTFASKREELNPDVLIRTNTLYFKEQLKISERSVDESKGGIRWKGRASRLKSRMGTMKWLVFLVFLNIYSQVIWSNFTN